MKAARLLAWVRGRLGMADVRILDSHELEQTRPEPHLQNLPDASGGTANDDPGGHGQKEEWIARHVGTERPADAAARSGQVRERLLGEG